MSRKNFKNAALYLTVVTTCAVLVFPVYWMFNTSVAPSTQLRTYPPQFLQSNPQFNSYITVLTERPLLIWLRNSTIIALAATLLSVSVSVLAGYSLSRFSVLGSQAMGIFVLTSRMLPGTLLVIPLFIFFRQLGLINDARSVIIAHATFIIPFATWMLKGYFDSIPKELEEAAMVDGCNPLTALFRVILPVAAPGLAATVLYGFILSWNDFLFARTFLTSQTTWTVTVGLSSMAGSEAQLTPWNQIMAASLLACVPVVLAYLFLERYLVGGLTAGAAKG